ncbi:DinB family protein [Paenibacillus sp. NPDC058071]|uniref:DinB family protein n=1 Tax=Paenibacillus sp. NPDC058071 TaxID=3346326 RepID=UPI0036DC1792
MSQLPIDLQRYLDTHQDLTQAINGLNEEALKWKQAPNSWSVTEVLSHLADHNLIVSFRLRDILADTTAVLPAFDQDLWVSGAYANEGSAEDILHVFQALLVYNSLLFKRLTDADWVKTGVNKKGETVTVKQIVDSFSDHVHRHIGQIDRIKTAYTKL